MTGDIARIQSVWPVLALAVFLGVPAFFGWLNSKAARVHAKAAYDETIHQANPNSGKSLKDSLNRIEAKQEQHDEVLADVVTRLSTVEKAAEKRSRRMWWK